MSYNTHPTYTPGFVPTNIITGKLGHETTPLDVAFTGTPNGQTTANGIVGPNSIYELMRQIWTPEILEHKFEQNLLINVFNAPVDDGWMNDLARTHSARITFKKWMNPLQRVRVEKLAYKDGVDCPKQLDVNCVIPPAGPLDEYETTTVDFCFEYSIRADICVKNEKFYPGQVEQQYAEDLQAVTYRRALDAWNALAQQIIESESPVLIPLDAKRIGATNHMVVAADGADFYSVASDVFVYMTKAFGQRFKRDFVITIHPELALDITRNYSQALSYEITGIRQDWIMKSESDYGASGFTSLPTMPRWGADMNVLVAPADVAMYNGTPNGENMNPWEGKATIDGVEYNTVRMIIASRRSFWTKTIQIMDKRIFPATVDNPVDSMVEIWAGGDKLIYPEETFLVDFCLPNA